MAQQVEHFHGKEGVPGSNPGSSSSEITYESGVSMEARKI